MARVEEEPSEPSPFGTGKEQHRRFCGISADSGETATVADVANLLKIHNFFMQNKNQHRDTRGLCASSARRADFYLGIGGIRSIGFNPALRAGRTCSAKSASQVL